MYAGSSPYLLASHWQTTLCRSGVTHSSETSPETQTRLVDSAGQTRSRSARRRALTCALRHHGPLGPRPAAPVACVCIQSALDGDLYRHLFTWDQSLERQVRFDLPESHRRAVVLCPETSRLVPPPRWIFTTLAVLTRPSEW